MIPLRNRERLDSFFSQMTRDPVLGLSGLAILAMDKGSIAYEGFFGRRRIDSENPDNDLPVTRDTKFRIASISKPVTAIGAMMLVEKGLLGLDDDLSDHLGFRLRNPHFPDCPITPAMLMSHTSSLRDEDFYFVPLGHELRDLFFPEGRYYAGGIHFAAPVAGADASPGHYYTYCNLNYGVLATAMENISGERFDLYMRDHVLGPLGLDGAYNVSLLSDSGLADLAALYRKAPAEGGPWDADGPWLPQVDDYRGRRPAQPYRVARLENGELPSLDDYRIGTNGTLFSPQGGLRISAQDLASIMGIFMKGGKSGGREFLKPETIDSMMTSRWKYDEAGGNGETYNGITRETGLALMHITDVRDSRGGDRLIPEGGVTMWGHHGDAYGLLGGMLFDPPSGRGLIYFIGGTAADPARNRGLYSSFPIWEEKIHEAVIREAFGISQA